MVEPVVLGRSEQARSVTWGVDLSTTPANTAAVAIEWSPGSARVTRMVTPLAAPELVDLIRAHPTDHWGIDVPFGWPGQFAQFVAAHQQGPTRPTYAEGSWASPLRLRRTDRELMAGEPARRVNPLSVAHDRLGAVAVLWAFVENALANSDPPMVIDRSGVTGSVFETYPAGIRVQWGLPKRGSHDELGVLAARLDAVEIDHTGLSAKGASEHAWDALLCALAARAHALGDRPKLSASQRTTAEAEGWIHLPQRALKSLVER